MEDNENSKNNSKDTARNSAMNKFAGDGKGDTQKLSSRILPILALNEVCTLKFRVCGGGKAYYQY